jgi:hypothetical protein
MVESEVSPARAFTLRLRSTNYVHNHGGVEWRSLRLRSSGTTPMTQFGISPSALRSHDRCLGGDVASFSAPQIITMAAPNRNLKLQKQSQFTEFICVVFQ